MLAVGFTMTGRALAWWNDEWTIRKKVTLGFVTAETLARGGFDSVSLNASQFIQFIGGASGMLTVSGMNNLQIHAPDFTATTNYSPAGNYSAQTARS